MTLLLLGIFIAAVVFAAMLFAAYQATITQGLVRYAHIATIAATIGVMASISYQNPLLMIGSGAILAIGAMVTLFASPGWSRILPLTLLTLGAFAILQIPLG